MSLSQLSPILFLNFYLVECDFCDEQEDQKHILECKALNKNNNEKYEKIPEYEEILKNNAKDQIKITRKFIENLEIRKQMAKTMNPELKETGTK